MGSTTPVPTMELRYFQPSEQLTGISRAPRGTNPFNKNYRGDPSLPSNTGAGVPEEKNTSLWITGLPGSITVTELLAQITKTGRVRSTVINKPTASISTAAASISFFERSDAEVLYRNLQQGRIIFDGKFPRVQWNRNRVREAQDLSSVSRVLYIAGDSRIVNRAYLDWFFSGKFVYDIDKIIDYGTVDVDGKSIGRLEYRFGSWRCQASSARQALICELSGFVWTAYGEDPCEV
ncbi:hypothetical protein F4776DRAFT_664034 [Hypoxylon sp. NC0597]|nr:hypothetical protein F4776DRAFT_664034 [Hypoxylon sp. NC0597]